MTEKNGTRLLLEKMGLKAVGGLIVALVMLLLLYIGVRFNYTFQEIAEAKESVASISKDMKLKSEKKDCDADRIETKKEIDKVEKKVDELIRMLLTGDYKKPT
jgi:uncharacterized protein YlxW (UPF0749 family)